MDSEPFPTEQEIFEQSTQAFMITIAAHYFVYGFYTLLFSISIYVLLRKKKPQYQIHCLFMITLFLLATAAIALNTTTYIQTPYARAQGDSANRLSVVALVLIPFTNMVSDAVLLWRCYLVWERCFKAIIHLAVICVVNDVLVIFLFWKAKGVDTGWSMGIFIFATVLTNLLLTLMIAGKIFHVTRVAAKLMGKNIQRTYQTIISIILESGIIYPLGLSVLGGFAVPTQNVSSLALLLLLHLWIPLAGIAPTLIIIRVGLDITHESAENTLTTFQAADRTDVGPVVDVLPSSRRRHSFTTVMSSRSEIIPDLEARKEQ